MGVTCQQAKADGYSMLVGSSGGNAGMAMAYAAKNLGMPITLFIPTSTPAMMIERLKVTEINFDKRGQNCFLKHAPEWGVKLATT
jgi:L-serine/L-threonine ammonia-lyase